MKFVVGTLFGMLLGIIGMSHLEAQAQQAKPVVVSAPKKPAVFKVGVGPMKAATGRVLAATATGGTLNVVRTQSCENADGSAVVRLAYSGQAGTVLFNRELNFPVNRTQPVVDNLNNQITATVPAAAGTNIDNVGAGWDTQIGQAAAGGKLNVQ